MHESTWFNLYMSNLEWGDMYKYITMKTVYGCGTCHTIFNEIKKKMKLRDGTYIV